MVQPLAKPLIGVNLGGWLLLERWMTPRLFAGTTAKDEYTFMQTPGAQAKLRQHQREFIVEEDWRWLHDNGIDIVRLPIGYWALDGDGPLRPCIGKLDWAVQMAKKYHIKLLICMHGAPGSQNGHDHSGRIGPIDWHRDKKNQIKTVDILKQIAQRYHNQPSVWGIELLNEPKMKLWQPTLRRFYSQAYQSITEVARPGLVTVFSDAFTPRLMNGALRAQPGFPVMMDHHWYHFFIIPQLQRWIPLSVYGWWLKYIKSPLIGRLSRSQPVIIGEWSGVMGSRKLHRYPKSQRKALVGWHFRVQQSAYSSAYAYIYWSYKNHSPGVHNFRSQVEDGWIKLPKR